ncbi:MAG: hypothetical protein WCR72_01610 [Bacteroidota bacterium]
MKEPVKNIFILSFSPAEVITKQQLSTAIGMKPRTFTKFLNTLEFEIRQISPAYNKNCSILTPKVAKFILEELGISLDDVRKRYWEVVNSNKNQNI